MLPAFPNWVLSPALESLGRDLEDARCGCGPYGHSSNLGKGVDGSFGTAGSGPYPHGLIACMAVHVGAWFVNRRSTPHSKEVIASFQLIAAQLCSRAIYPQGPQARGNSAGQSSSAPRQGALQYFECRRKLFRCMCTCTPAHHSVAGQVFVHLLDRRTLHRPPSSPTCDCVKDPSALILQVIGVSWSRWTVRKRSPPLWPW